MKPNFIPAALILSGIICINSASAVKLNANDNQKMSLKGITSVKYIVENKASYDADADAAEGLSGLKIPVKHSKELPPDFYNALGPNEARVKIITADKGKELCWVGLLVEQRCQMKRTPVIEFDSETYKTDIQGPIKNMKANIKTLCTEFVAELARQNSKD